MIERGERKRTADDVSKADWAISKPGGCHSSGISLGMLAGGVKEPSDYEYGKARPMDRYDLIIISYMR
jgi:hypothetical protein